MKFSEMPYERPDLDKVKRELGDLTGRLKAAKSYEEARAVFLEKEEAESLYRMFGRVYRDIPPRWRVLVITSHPEFERFFGRKADKKRKLYNGMIKCDLYQFSR